MLRSSHCLSGGRFDRHSGSGERYIRRDGNQGVIFEEPGAGAITRIWMTTGEGTSKDLDPSVTIRIYLDGKSVPIVELPLPDLFNGSTPPFLFPLVGNRPISSGGNFSYVPIPYRQGCRVTLEGSDSKNLWYQFNFHRLVEGADVTTFTGKEDLGDWATLLSADGEDPWPIVSDGSALSSSVLAGNVSIEPGKEERLANPSGPDSITSLRLQALPQAWPELELILRFDGRDRVRMPLNDFFAAGREGLQPTRSLLIGVDDEGYLYCYFPMPFFEGAEISLRSLSSEGALAVDVSYAVRVAGEEPSSESGFFGAQLSYSEATPLRLDFPFLNLRGQGKWVGLFADMGSVATSFRGYLEGDERVFIDESPHPAVYGTGVEDFYNGGFYFDHGSFLSPLHGSPYHVGLENGEDVTSAYRLMLTDSISFSSSLFAGLQVGPTSNFSMRPRIVAYYYQRPTPRLVRSDVLDLGDTESRAAHGYTVIGEHTTQSLEGLFEGEPPEELKASGVYRPMGRSQFVLRADPRARSWKLRRRFDAGLGSQQADVYINGVLAGRFPPVPQNVSRRWYEIDIELPRSVGDTISDGNLFFSVVSRTESFISSPPDPVPVPAGVPPNAAFSEFQYELWADVYPFSCPGDVNEDGRQDVSDMVAIRRQLTGEIELLGVPLASADVNRDGTVSVLDMVRLHRHLVGKSALSGCSLQESADLGNP